MTVEKGSQVQEGCKIISQSNGEGHPRYGSWVAGSQVVGSFFNEHVGYVISFRNRRCELMVSEAEGRVEP